MLARNRFVESMTAGSGQGAALGILITGLKHWVLKCPPLACWRTKPSTKLSTALKQSLAVTRTNCKKPRIPGCIYCQPQVASIGLSEAAALKKGYKTRVGRFPFAANGKAVALGDTDGFVKTVFDNDTGELLGAHLVGPEVTELIHGFATAACHETTDEHLLQLVYPHPTRSEALHESTLIALGRAIHY